MPESEAPDQVEPTTFNLLFVCTGNTCRSPMARVIAQQALQERGWLSVAVDSAGTAAAPGQPAAESAIRVAAEHGLDLSWHESKPLTEDLVDWADLILVMTPPHLDVVVNLGGAEKAALLGEFLPEADEVDIPDPLGNGDDAYRRTFDLLSAAIGTVLRRLEPILAP
jgi:protein-tyrosine-phosphatase